MLYCVPLPKPWDTMTHNESIISFSQLPHHLELEEERLEFRTDMNVYVLSQVNA